MITNDFVVTADQINTIETARVRLFDCTTKKEVEEVFDSFKISNPDARIALLHRCMQVKNVYGINGDKEEDQKEFYEETLDFFVDGQWRDFI